MTDLRVSRRRVLRVVGEREPPVLRLHANAEFSDGETVDTPDGAGIIDDVVTEGTVDGEEASSDDPIYAVVVEDESVGVGFYRESDLSDGELPAAGPDDPAADLGGQSANALRANQEGHFTWPESWRKSDTPARLIALRAWAAMGGKHGGGTPPTGCVAEMAGEVASPNRFCADFKDRLYGTEKWRGGWAD